jgi:hypothetical protein
MRHDAADRWDERNVLPKIGGAGRAWGEMGLECWMDAVRYLILSLLLGALTVWGSENLFWSMPAADLRHWGRTGSWRGRRSWDQSPGWGGWSGGLLVDDFVTPRWVDRCDEETKSNEELGLEGLQRSRQVDGAVI